MRTKLYFVAALAATMLASCADDKFVGENSPNVVQENAGEGIRFGLNVPGRTRADIYGGEAAKLLGYNFYVMGTKGTEPSNSPTTTVVFDNYLVHWAANTAGNKESNTANWEYVDVNPGSGATADYYKTGSYSVQTIKYWDYSQPQYDFFAFSTGPNKAVNKTTPDDNEIGVTTMKSGDDLASNKTAYTLYIPRVEDLKETYITDINEVLKTKYGKDVTLRFMNIGAKIRVALYETVPGYSVKNVLFYNNDDKPIDHLASGYVEPTATATLINAEGEGFTSKGQINVSFPYVGTSKEGHTQTYDKASAVVIRTNGVKTQTFGALTNQLVERADKEDDSSSKDKLYLGRTLPTASFAGLKTEDYYQTVFPATATTNSLTLRVDYTLVSTDGSKEEIKVYGATAVVPAIYTNWKPNYAYTYIFKISDNTNGWTDEAQTAQGLFPITFDAVVAEAIDVNGEQRTVTTVSLPSITTYQQNHNKEADEYSQTGDKDIYVRIMDNTTLPGTLITGLNNNNSLLYELSVDASEAKVIDALQMRTTEVGTVSTNNVTGRNDLGLTNMTTSAISNTVTSIVNGIDDKEITTGITSGTLAKIDISALTAGKSYAYVYIKTANTKEKVQFEPVPTTSGQKIDAAHTSHVFYQLTTSQIGAGTTVNPAEAPHEDYVYFSEMKDGTGAVTGYSYISPLGKESMPVGCKKVAKSVLTDTNTTVTGNDNAAEGVFYFDKYILNDGVYAVKVIKIIS